MEKIQFILLIVLLATLFYYFYFFQGNKVDNTITVFKTDTVEMDNDLMHHCQNIHVAIICGGHETTLRTINLLKSLLYYRHDKIILHLLVDDIALSILSSLFETWLLPSVNVVFYNASSLSYKVSWIPNKHYSKNFGLLKLLLPEVISSNVPKIISIDSDMIILHDIAELWDYWFQMNSHAIGLTENLSGWYNNSDNIHHPWPALGRGFNTGIMLLDLERLRIYNWSKIWRSVTKKNLKIYKATHLADQDIINAIVANERSIYYRLPCEWNLQLGYQASPSLCTDKLNKIKAIHWNSPKKMRTENRYSAFFRRYFVKFITMDGNLLRTTQLKCFEDLYKQFATHNYSYDDNMNDCAEFQEAKTIIYRTQLYIRPYSYDVKKNDVTLNTQLSADRLASFEQIVRHWNGPISVAIYLTDLELTNIVGYLNDQLYITNRTNIALHAVFKEREYYPINYLRNVALNASQTKFVFLVDVDFIPMPGLYELIIKNVASMETNRQKALVIPAFEFRCEQPAQFPTTKVELLAMIDAGIIQIFRQYLWIQGHAATDYDKWRIADSQYSVVWRMDYEPYIVIKRDEVPQYDRRFVGFGWNKVAHIMALNAIGFEFIVLPDAFMIHQAHSPSFEILKYRSSGSYRKCLKALKGQFVRDLVRSEVKRQMISSS